VTPNIPPEAIIAQAREERARISLRQEVSTRVKTMLSTAREKLREGQALTATGNMLDVVTAVGKVCEALECFVLSQVEQLRLNDSEMAATAARLDEALSRASSPILRPTHYSRPTGSGPATGGAK